MNAGRRLCFLLIAVMACVCLSCGENKGGGPDNGTYLFMVELEHFSASYDDPASKVPIGRQYCANASNDTSAVGLDVAGEWIMVPVDVPEDGMYSAHLSYAAESGDVITARLEMDKCGDATQADFVLDAGTGTG